MPNSTRLDRVRGCLLGLAIGDALGAPLEGLSPQQIRAHYGVVDNYTDGVRAWKKKPLRWRLPGLYTDDTQQALVLSEVLLAHQRMVPEAIADLYLRLAEPKGSYVGAHRSVGKSFRQVVADLERGMSPADTGSDSAGITAAVRIAPVALYFTDRPEAIHDEILAASWMTHRDIRSLAGAAAVAHAVRRLAAGAERSAGLIFRVAADVAQTEERLVEELGPKLRGVSRHRRAVSTAIAHTERVLDMPRDRALHALIDEANRHGANPSCRRATRGFPPVCIPTCLYLLLTTDSFEEALQTVVNLGGDADSAGAILGALAGAHYGVAAIPDRWRRGLRNHRGIDLRAEALCRRSGEGLDLPDLVATEWELSNQEEAYRGSVMASGPNGGDISAGQPI